MELITGPDGVNNSRDSNVNALLKTIASDLDRGVLPVEIFNDPAVHALEMERIFARCWVFLGHESEIRSPGDYVLRYIADDQFILARDEQGAIRVLFNRCAHRGSPICRAEKGNATHFRCPYHSWIYKNSGEWNGAPLRRRAYRELDPAEWGLRAAPHVDTIYGLIFASLDPNAPTLSEYLGEMRWYLDVVFGQSKAGMRVLGEPNKWRVPTNWKMGAENFVADSYHVASLHRSIEEVGAFPNIDITGGNGPGRHVHFDSGHGMLLNQGYLPPPWDKGSFPPEVSESFDLELLDADQREFIKSYAVTHFLIFPNLALLRVPSVVEPGGTPRTYTMLRQWQPLGPEEVITWNWVLGWNTAPDSFSDYSYSGALIQHGPSGILEQDDTVAWSGAHEVGRSAFARASGMKFNYQLGLGAMSDYAEDASWRWPGHASTGILGEAPQRALYRRWLSELETPST